MPSYSDRCSYQKSNLSEEEGADALGALDLKDLAAAIMPAIPAHAMGKRFLPAVGAGD